MSSGPSSKIIAMISLIIVAIAFLATTPIIVDQVQDVNTTGWDFTGYEGAIVLLDLVPFAWIASGLVMMVVGAFGLAKRGA